MAAARTAARRLMMIRLEMRLRKMFKGFMGGI